MAVAKCYPLYTCKTNEIKPKKIYVRLLVGSEEFKDYAMITQLCYGVRLAGKLVDIPTCDLHTNSYVDQHILPLLEELKKVAEKKGEQVSYELIRGTDLRDKGFGGLWNVGKAAENLPCLVIMNYKVPKSKKTMCWVGKGIVYDTGGLSLKGKDYMVSMKCDMGGSAAVLSAFRTYVMSDHEKYYSLHGLLCLAENAVSDRSYRPDDILKMYSGKTVEINNTDAEGRLVLADGVAYCTKHLNPDVVIDIATLTGAVLITTGKKMAGVLSNDETLEKKIVQCSRNAGDLVFPLIYAPEVLLEQAKQFKSEIADMKNSVKDRSNAQSSCAGHFIEEHLVGDKWDWRKNWEGEKGLWAHLDIAGTAFDGKRGTGAGCALLFEIADKVRI